MLRTAALLGDLSFLDGTFDRVQAALPSRALAATGASLAEVGERMAAIDLADLTRRLEAIAPRTIDQTTRAAEAIQREIVALLGALDGAGGTP